MTARVELLDRDRFAGLADDVLDVYAEAMDVSPDAARSRRSILTAHLQRTGLRSVGAFDEQGRLVGVAYGYRGAPGQWWHDQVRSSLSDDDAARWLSGSFEVCEFHVRPSFQGTGLGRELLARLLELAEAPTAVLTTPDVETRARRFYRAGGWVDLARQLRFPGDPRTFAVLALPLVSGE